MTPCGGCHGFVTSFSFFTLVLLGEVVFSLPSPLPEAFVWPVILQLATFWLVVQVVGRVQVAFWLSGQLLPNLPVTSGVFFCSLYLQQLYSLGHYLKPS